MGKWLVSWLGMCIEIGFVIIVYNFIFSATLLYLSFINKNTDPIRLFLVVGQIATIRFLWSSKLHIYKENIISIHILILISICIPFKSMISIMMMKLKLNYFVHSLFWFNYPVIFSGYRLKSRSGNIRLIGFGWIVGPTPNQINFKTWKGEGEHWGIWSRGP